MNSVRLTIPGYSIHEELYSSSRTLVYRGLRDLDGQPVAIKLMRNSHPRFTELVQFCNQHAIARHLPNTSNIVKPCALEAYNNSYALIMEDFGGISLSNYLRSLPLAEETNPYLGISEFIAIALQLADILNTLHQHRIIHKDIKPANILIHPDTQQIKLTDFSISSLLPKETQEIQNPNTLEGTLVYLSPEQTGRMNRGIDYRSDFYSLGVTFYELLTGQLPFPSTDPMELVHCHIAKQPPPVSQIKPDVPAMLSKIVSKLMAKNAEDRYQSAQGLKHDLEQCWYQWQNNTRIEPFLLGLSDISGRFLIPEKLYGRYTEVATLLAAFDRVSRGATEFMLVTGFSGIGKTAVVNEVHKPIVRQRGYFIQGKFDQLQRNIPFSAFVQAFRDLTRQLLTESNSQLQEWKAKILQALGNNAQVIIEVVPELELILGTQPAIPTLSGTEGQNRFYLLFHKFIQVFAASGHPLTIFLDDLQWADSASLKLTHLLLSETDTRHLFLIGAYRDNEVSATHPLTLTLAELAKTPVTIYTLTLAPLSSPDLNHLIADTLSCSAELAQPLTELVYQKTQGNPFFANQFLKVLHEDGLIAFNTRKGYWECDIAQVRSLALTDDVVEFMMLQLQKLPSPTQEVLQFAACIGNAFDLATLAIVCEQSQTQVAAALWPALQDSLVLPTSEVYKFFQNPQDADFLKMVSQLNPDRCAYKFLHDRIQQAAYSLIPEAQKQAIHLKIGRLLLQHTALQEREEQIFAIVNPLNQAVDLITDEAEKLELAQLNWVAGHKAKASTAYDAAVAYLQTGLALLPGDRWSSHYTLTLKLQIEAAEAEYLRVNFAGATELAEIALQNAANLIDRVEVYELQMQICIAQLQMVQAIDIGLNTLAQLGVSLVNMQEGGEIALPQLADLEQMPTLTEPNQLAAMQMMKNLCAPVFMAKPEILPQIIITMVRLCLEGGNSPLSAFAYAFYGLLQVGMGQLDEGYQAGQIALKLLNKFDAKEVKAKVYNLFNSNIRTWKEHAKNSVEPLKEGVQSGLETGDMEWGGYCAANLAGYLFFTGKNLEEVVQEQKTYIDLSLKIKQDLSCLFAQIWRQLGLNLQGLASEPSLLIGESFDEAQILPRLIAAKSGTTLFIFYVAKTILFYHLQKPAQALEMVALANEQMAAAFGFIQVVVLNFYHSLALLAEYPHVDPTQQAAYLEQVKVNQEKLRFWTQHAPANNQHRFELVEAEKARILGQYWQALEGYERAIALAQENDYIAECAIANQLAAQFYLECHQEKIAQLYLIDAYYAYARWGAKAKIDEFERRYPQLLAPILQQVSDSPISSTQPQSSRQFTRQTIHSSGTSTGNVLDLMTVIKISQTLSSEIQLEQLLATFMQVVMENAGADKCVLLLPQAETWVIKAIAKSASDDQQSLTEVSEQSLEDSQELPISLVNYVKRTQQTLAILDVSAEPRLLADPYITKRQPQSILCSPIWHQGSLIGILYLENSLASGAFTSDRVEMLHLLSTQAAISLENARLYQESQQALENLQQMQLQLVQSEKMSALGNLVAGVAHEINNPVGFIAGNLHPAKQYIQELLGLIDLYEKQFPHPGDAIATEIDTIDLAYLREDLPNLLESMQVGVERIRNISSSLRTFSRGDKAYKVPFNIHEGIDSTLLILKHRLKANEQRPAIQIVKNYGQLPPIQCFPGQLNQVFMNILANAIDAFDELNQGCSFEEIAARTSRIEIETQVQELGQQVSIYIRDNGPGMSTEVKQHIFDHLFTTKGVGQGTGLGLAIARQIVVEAHGGTLTVSSELGRGTEFVIALPVNLPSNLGVV